MQLAGQQQHPGLAVTTEARQRGHGFAQRSHQGHCLDAMSFQHRLEVRYVRGPLREHEDALVRARSEDLMHEHHEALQLGWQHLPALRFHACGQPSQCHRVILGGRLLDNLGPALAEHENVDARHLDAAERAAEGRLGTRCVLEASAAEHVETVRHHRESFGSAGTVRTAATAAISFVALAMEANGALCLLGLQQGPHLLRESEGTLALQALVAQRHQAPLQLVLDGVFHQECSEQPLLGVVPRLLVVEHDHIQPPGDSVAAGKPRTNSLRGARGDHRTWNRRRAPVLVVAHRWRLR
mmetsp:Transcript_123471/g.348944  ORF Transcript_123471/g.348944 Transcript_123471/m.348944 type:complete len:297 (+) Transcript_123471:296-1186(+)